MFQKYVWAWWESTSKVSPRLLATIEDDVILYNGYVPILPYFSCSAGFTRSAKDKRWRSDTPYLQSKLDFGACFDFNGHGVGLSGKWAQFLAEKWWTVEQILQYYYPGVTLTSL
jgi:peptidoglycan hydrolase-like amidase